MYSSAPLWLHIVACFSPVHHYWSKHHSAPQTLGVTAPVYQQNNRPFVFHSWAKHCTDSSSESTSAGTRNKMKAVSFIRRRVEFLRKMFSLLEIQQVLAWGSWVKVTYLVLWDTAFHRVSPNMCIRNLTDTEFGLTYKKKPNSELYEVKN